MKRETIDIHSYRLILEEQGDYLKRFEELLINENRKYNLTRMTSPQQIRTRHFLDSLAGLAVLDELAIQLQKPLRVLDIGSGAGFPGLVLALARPDWSVVSLEATDKKARFQQTVCTAMGLNNVEIIYGRAEEMAHQTSFREQFDAVTARAVASLPVLSELALGFLREQGLALFWKGPNVEEETVNADGAAKQMGGRIEKIVTYMLPDKTEGSIDFSLVVCRKIHPTPKKYPRVFGMIKKQPLGVPSKS
jgi:16S rRNA (guanine527-N7)-methyltransferase